MEKKIISVVIPTYNRQIKIIRALESVFNQTRFDLIGEIIIVDDGSQDDTLSLLEVYKNNHNSIEITIISQSNQGASSARNRGIETARYEYIALLDSDDEWMPEKTEKQMKIFLNHPDAGLVGGNNSEKNMRILGRQITSLHKASLKELCLKFFPVTPSVILKKSIFDEIGGFDETIYCYEDCDYFQRICAAGYGYYYLPEQVVICDRGKRMFGQEGLSANLEQSYKDSIISIKKLLKASDISITFYAFLRFLYLIKHIRRKIISKVVKKC